MTRINIIDPFELSDQHLMAEYREMLMVPAALRRSLQTRSVESILAGIPARYTLNKGHVTFFYNKLFYLEMRYSVLRQHLKQRGFRLDPDREFNVTDLPALFYQNWELTGEDEKVIRDRLTEKLRMKPDWYRWTPAATRTKWSEL